jgi:hypothetical protein
MLQRGSGEVNRVGADDEVQRGFVQFGDLEECAGDLVPPASNTLPDNRWSSTMSATVPLLDEVVIDVLPS